VSDRVSGPAEGPAYRLNSVRFVKPKSCIVAGLSYPANSRIHAWALTHSALIRHSDGATIADGVQPYAGRWRCHAIKLAAREIAAPLAIIKVRQPRQRERAIAME
jgi:hypothetical protein